MCKKVKMSESKISFCFSISHCFPFHLIYFGLLDILEIQKGFQKFIMVESNQNIRISPDKQVIGWDITHYS